MSFVVRKAKRFPKPFSQAAASVGPGEEKVAPSSYFRWKRLLGLISAVILAIPALPLTGLLIVLVRATSRGPGIYRQKRVGLRGRIFTLYKIRTMRCDAEAESGPVWTEPNDPRVTGLGRLLRKVHLDELPQLINVIRGDMMLVGPRPERPEFTQHLAKKVPGYMNRYSVPPGITGLAQINLPPDTDLASVSRKLILDLEYIRDANLLLDLRILICTSLRLVGVPWVPVARALRLERDPAEPEVPVEESPEEGRPVTYREILAAKDSGNGACKATSPKKDGITAA